MCWINRLSFCRCLCCCSSLWKDRLCASLWSLAEDRTSRWVTTHQRYQQLLLHPKYHLSLCRGHLFLGIPLKPYIYDEFCCILVWNALKRGCIFHRIWERRLIPICQKWTTFVMSHIYSLKMTIDWSIKARMVREAKKNLAVLCKYCCRCEHLCLCLCWCRLL